MKTPKYWLTRVWLWSENSYCWPHTVRFCEKCKANEDARRVARATFVRTHRGGLVLTSEQSVRFRYFGIGWCSMAVFHFFVPEIRHMLWLVFKIKEAGAW